MSGLQIVDISDANQPEVEGFYDDNTGWEYGVAVQNDYADIADNSGFISGFIVVDISDKSGPVEVGFTDTRCNKVAILGDYAYVVGSRFSIIDISDPTNPQEVGFFETPGRATDVEAFWDYAYVADASRALRVIDVGDLCNPREVGVLETSVRTLTLLVIMPIWLEDYT